MKKAWKVSGIILVLLLGMIVSLIPAYATETWFSVVPNHTITSPGKVFTVNTRGTEEGGEVYTTTIEPIVDTYVDRLYHWKNFGNKNILCIMGNWSYPGGQTCYISFLKFDLSDIPPSAKIVSAELYLRVVEYSVDTPEVTTIKAHRYLNDTWDEHNLTWDGVNWDQIQNATSETEIYVDLLETQVWFNWTITEDVKKSKDGFLTEVLSASGGESIFFYSKETSLKPYLNVTYTFSTPVGGIIWENTTWTLENSPYIITDTVQIPENVTLTIEPSATVTRPTSGDMFLLHGTVYAHGTIKNKIVFDGGGNSEFFTTWGGAGNAYLDYCIIRNGYRFWNRGGYFNLTHSELTNLTHEILLESPSADICIEYNKFVNTGGLHAYQAAGRFCKIYVRYNLFQKLSSSIHNAGGSPGLNEMIVKYNSFIDVEGIILSLCLDFNSAVMNATENYWGTLDMDVIDSKIQDRNDDIRIKNYINYLPILSEPHPDTPKISSTIYVDDDNTAGPWDGTVEHPYQNITQGLKHASDNDTIFVFSGTYYENVVVNKTLCLIAENREDTIIDARGIGDVLRIEADNVTVSNFTIQYGDNGIYLIRSHGSTIRNNNVTTNINRGILGMYSTGNNFDGNIVNNNGGQAGIDLTEDSIDNIIRDNIITNNGVGIYLRYNSGNNTVQGNKVQSNSRGINIGARTRPSNNNTIVSNIIASSGDYGILFEYCSDNNVCGNLIADNSAGIKLVGGNDNKISHNNFIDNADQVLLSISFNIWDDGYPSGGNYWSDYTGVDLHSGSFQNETGCDGIGDTPYVIDENNQDSYPLMKPYPDITPPIIAVLSPENLTYVTTSIPLEFAVNECTSWMGYSLDGEANVTVSGNTTLTGLSEGGHNVIVYANDTAGNMGCSDTISFMVDVTLPTTTHEYDGKWHVTDFTITLIAVDYESGVAETYYTINDGTVKAISIDGQPYITTENANNTLEYWSMDNAGNEELPHKILTSIKLDKTAPMVGLPHRIPEGEVQPDREVKVSVNVTDSMSGVKSVRLKYTSNRSVLWLDFPMTFNSTTGLWEFVIPGQQANTLVKYRIEAYDNALNHKVDDNSGQYYVYTVIPEFPQPIILLLFAFTTLIATILLKKKARPKSPPQFSFK